jgi:hypothetical protein
MNALKISEMLAIHMVPQETGTTTALNHCKSLASSTLFKMNGTGWE